MVSLMPSAGVNPLVSDQFRFQKVLTGETKQSYICQCGHLVEGTQAFELQPEFGQPLSVNAAQEIGLSTQGRYAQQNSATMSQPWHQAREPTMYLPDASADVCCSCPNCGCLQHRPAAPTPISMSCGCDPCRQAGGANTCCPPQPNRPLQTPGVGWGYCPPIQMDPKALIRPRDKSLPDSTRPTGARYFAQEAKKSCPPFQVPKPMKSSFTYKDWLNTVKDREPKDCLGNCCIPSLCTWCAPQYYDCCANVNDPRLYFLTRQSLPPFY
ncbi:serine/threonine-protein kinase yakA [Biomphalaria pfeifferi]|uniref:Serine/threonine-protein kinase yakA n=1 Tax=Biomphalaria pfeifferi TaxID=112525 RepID=A0AAD8B5Q4_BIOPF|nr:serine/threonine-protein kinase yakA [Biomphalaria pfeifferi]